MKNRKYFYTIICVCIIMFIIVIAYWTILPRTATLDIPGEGIYTGQLRGTIFHGYGKYESYAVGGTSYEGEWQDGVFHGQGTLTFANGSKLVGNFVDGSIQGIGQSICPDGHITEIDLGEGTVIDNHQGCDHDN
jgi:hypothetical protein